jgi:uncharacterized repeat protein (TIGR03833 family)
MPIYNFSPFLLLLTGQVRRSEFMKNGNNRSDIQIGSKVEVVQKQDQRSGNLTEGTVSKILTNSTNHPHGIKVMLETGVVGRVKRILD